MKKYFQILFILLSFSVISCDSKPKKEEKSSICTTIDDCNENFSCINGFCKVKNDVEKCFNNNDCPENYYCNSESKCELKSCTSKADCKEEEICLNTKCIDGCNSNSDCQNDRICNNDTHKCEEDCRTQDKCEEGYECDQVSGECKIRTICNNIEKTCAVGYKCENSQCIPKIACTTNEECAMGEFCRNDGYCDIDTGCNNDQYCINKNPQKPACNSNINRCEDPCNEILCSNHGDCKNNNNVLSCDCDEDYYVDGFYCIYDSHNCEVDQFSNPLNNTSDTAKIINFGSYDNLTLGNSNCGYVKDWYKIDLLANTQLNFNLTYSDTADIARNISIKLYNNTNFSTPIKSNTSPDDLTRSILYSVTEDNIYYIKVLIYYTTDQKNISYSMVVSSD